MAVTDWASDGMNWSSLSNKRLNSYMEAIRQAINERSFAIANAYPPCAISPNPFESSLEDHIGAFADIVNAIDHQLDLWIFGNFEGAATAVDFLGRSTAGHFANHTDSSGEWDATNRPPPRWTYSTMLSAISATDRIRSNGKELCSSTYKWTLSGSGTDEYYCELAAGGDPNLSEPEKLYIAWLGPPANRVRATAGSLGYAQWDYADNDSLGYSTVYVRVGLNPYDDPNALAQGSIHTVNRHYYINGAWAQQVRLILNKLIWVTQGGFASGGGNIYTSCQYDAFGGADNITTGQHSIGGSTLPVAQANALAEYTAGTNTSYDLGLVRGFRTHNDNGSNSTATMLLNTAGAQISKRLALSHANGNQHTQRLYVFIQSHGASPEFDDFGEGWTEDTYNKVQTVAAENTDEFIRLDQISTTDPDAWPAVSGNTRGWERKQSTGVDGYAIYEFDGPNGFQYV